MSEVEELDFNIYALLQDMVVTLYSNISRVMLVFNLGDDFTHEFNNGIKYFI